MTDLLLKQPWEEVTLAMEFQGSDLDNPPLVSGRAISSIDSVTVEASKPSRMTDLTVSGEAISGTKVTFKATGGTDGQAYPIRIRVVDDAGDKLEGDGLLLVQDE